MTAPRPVLTGRTYLITRRCTQRQFLLRPDPKVEQLYIYCLAEAARRFEISVHAYVAMSNHQHVVVRDNRGNYPEFVAHLNKLIAKAMNAQYKRRENFWSSEQSSVVHLVDPSDRLDKVIYVLANPVADHLVEHVADWPGASSLALHLSGRQLTVRRPAGFFRKRGPMPAEVTLQLERPAGFEKWTEAQWREAIEKKVRAAENRARAERQKNGIRVLGRKAVLRTKPTDTPKTVEAPVRLRPLIACKNRKHFRHAVGQLLAFRIEYRTALHAVRMGQRDVVFPVGTYRLQEFFDCEAPPVPRAA